MIELHDPLPVVAWVTGLSTGLGLILRSRPVRWLWRRNISEPFAGKMRAIVTEVVASQLASQPWTNGESWDAIRSLQQDVTELRRCIVRLTPVEIEQTVRQTTRIDDPGERS